MYTYNKEKNILVDEKGNEVHYTWKDGEPITPDMVFSFLFASKEQEEKKRDPFIEKHLAIIKEKMVDSNIELHIKRNLEYLRPSIKYFLESGSVSGEFYLSLKKLSHCLEAWHKQHPATPVEGVEEDNLREVMENALGSFRYLRDLMSKNKTDKALCLSMIQAEIAVLEQYLNIQPKDKDNDE